MTSHRRSACLHRLALRPSRRSQGQDHRRVLQIARRAAAAGGRLSRRAYSGRGVLRRRCHRRPRQSAAAYVSGRRAVRARRRRARHFLRRYRGRLRFRRLGCGAAGVVDVPVVRPPQCEGARRRLEEMAARGPPDAFRQGHAEAWKIPGQIRSQLSSAASSNWSAICETHAEQVVDARPRAAFRRHRRRAAAGPARRSHPGQPQRALCRIVRRRDRRDEAAGRVAQDLHARRRRYGKADRDHLRLRRLRAGA